jgi:hypothetical protein
MQLFSRRNALAALALVAAVGAAGFVWLQLRPAVRSPELLLSALPPRGGTLILIDVAALRKSGFLKMFAASKAASGGEYREFVEQTGFDYERDLDMLAVESTPDATYYAAAGDFQWNKIQRYLESNGGACQDGLCRMASSQPGRHISLYAMDGSHLAVAVATDAYAASLIAPRKTVAGVTPVSPVWILVPSSVLREGSGLPAGTRAFATPISRAERIEFFVEPARQNLTLVARVLCRDAQAAAQLEQELRKTTEQLNKMLSRDGIQPSPRDLAAVLASGTFETEGSRLTGRWMLRKPFLEALAGGEIE